MLIDTELIMKLVLEENISAYDIEKEVGVSRDTISKVRRGDRKFKNLTVETIEKLQTYINKEDLKMKYEIKLKDYKEAIEEYNGQFIIGYDEDGSVDFYPYNASPNTLHIEEVDDAELVELSEDELYLHLSSNYESVANELEYEVEIIR